MSNNKQSQLEHVLERTLTLDEIILCLCNGQLLCWLTVHDGNKTFEVATVAGPKKQGDE